MIKVKYKSIGLKRFLCATLLLICWFHMNSQDLSVSYDLQYRPDYKVDSLKTTAYVLDIVGSRSVFRTKAQRESDSLSQATGLKGGSSLSDEQELYLTKDLKSNLIKKFVTNPVTQTSFFIKINEPLKWIIGSQTKLIGEYQCQLATTTYGGRNWVAWFTSEVPIPEGPYVFQGLPGIIVKISDDHSDYSFSLTRLKRVTNKQLYSKLGIEITWAKFRDLQIGYFRDPFSSLKTHGIKAVVEDDNGHTQPLDFREWTKEIQSKMLKNNNPIELNHKVEYK